MPWTREELEGAFENYQKTVVRATQTGDWNLFADMFTEDATTSSTHSADSRAARRFAVG